MIMTHECGKNLRSDYAVMVVECLEGSRESFETDEIIRQFPTKILT